MKILQKIILTFAFISVFVVATFWLLSLRSVPAPQDIRYGVTFSKFRAEELHLDWKETYEALLMDLKVKHFRLVAHWDMVEPEHGVYHFDELDYQMRRAGEEGASVILAIGRRLPSWPECHEPAWIDDDPLDKQKEYILAYLTEMVGRYKDSPALKEWQVENEPFIVGFAKGHCGKLDIDFLRQEITLVHTLDPKHPILLTGSGELGFWANTWRLGDVFGTTLYRQVWNRDLNSFISYPTTPAFYRFQRTVAEFMTGEKKPAIIAELAAEPWLEGPTVNAPLEEQLTHMNLDTLKRSVSFASKTSFDEQYFWGAEWWYYLKKVHDDTTIWEWAKQYFNR